MTPLHALRHGKTCELLKGHSTKARICSHSDLSGSYCTKIDMDTLNDTKFYVKGVYVLWCNYPVKLACLKASTGQSCPVTPLCTRWTLTDAHPPSHSPGNLPLSCPRLNPLHHTQSQSCLSSISKLCTMLSNWPPLA